MFLEEWGHHFRLVLPIEVSQVLILEWVSPAIPDLTVLPPPRDPREEGGISLRAWTTLYKSNIVITIKLVSILTYLRGVHNRILLDLWLMEQI